MANGIQTIKQPTVTVILPVGPDSLNMLSCLESLIQQKYPNLEIIVVDNGLKRKTLTKISEILESTDFMSVVWKQEHLRRRTYWIGSEEIHGELIFLASSYVIYDRNCLKNLVSRLQEDQRIKAAIPERLSGFNSRSITQKCLSTIESTIKHQGDAFGGLSINGILFWKENMEKSLYWDLMQDGYLETGVTRIHNQLGFVVTVKEAQCQPNQPRSFLEFFRSVYLEARYDRPYLPFRTHTLLSAIIMVVFVFIGVIMEVILNPYEWFSGQIIMTFLIPLYVIILLSRLLIWENIVHKWILIFIPVLRVLSAFAYVSGILQKYLRFDKLITTVVDTPETTILPTTLILLLLKNINHELATNIFMKLFFLGFVISLTLLKGSKLFNHLFYGFMLSAPLNIVLTWVHNEKSFFGNIPALLLKFVDPLAVCFIIGSLVYFPFLVKHVRTNSRQI